jgi:hypothetical protein
MRTHWPRERPVATPPARAPRVHRLRIMNPNPNPPQPQQVPNPVNPDPKAHPIHPNIPSQPIHEPLETGEGPDPKRPITPGTMPDNG